MTTAFQEYPKMLYSSDGQKMRLVHNENQEAIARVDLFIPGDEQDAPMLDLKSARKAAARKAED